MSDPWKELRGHDPDLVLLEAARAELAVSPRFQGRIFGALEGRLTHQLLPDLLAAPPGGAFKNIGGNSLWPAPEGGPLAFNYPPDGGNWYVQEGIADAPTRLTHRGEHEVAVEKQITLVNRMGTRADITFRRTVELLGDASEASPGPAQLHYRTLDELVPRSAHTPESLLLSAWSLEQFAGGEGVLAFADADDPVNVLNADFYGALSVPPRIEGSRVWLTLGGTDRWQVGFRVDSGPRRIGALDTANGRLIIRRTPRQEGRYFNIADNDQPRGPWSAADQYSVFNGGELGFYELETIAPMAFINGNVGPSRLESETWIYQGPEPALKTILENPA